MIYANERADSSPELAGELRTAAGDDVMRYTSSPDHVLKEQPWQLRSVDIFPAGQENCDLSQSVDTYQNPGTPRCC